MDYIPKYISPEYQNCKLIKRKLKGKTYVSLEPCKFFALNAILKHRQRQEK